MSAKCRVAGRVSRTVPAVTFPGSRKWSGAFPLVALALGLPMRDGPAKYSGSGASHPSILVSLLCNVFSIIV